MRQTISTPPGSYMQRLFGFLSEISVNNNRPWFEEHRAEYQWLRDRWMADVDRLIGLMSVWDPAMASQTAKSCAYRFYRDTRFSNDKSPYKTFFSALFSPLGRKTDHAAYYLQVGVDESGLYGGLWMPPPAMLKKVRRAVIDNVEELDEILAAPDMKRWFPHWCEGGSLKTAPQGWPKDHPRIDLLRLRQYGRECILDRGFFMRPDWVEEADRRFHALKPLIDFLNYSIDEEEEPQLRIL